MGGEAFGARQTWDVPAELQSYEKITSIEFILDTPMPQDFCSAAYRPVEGGGQTRTRVGLEDELVDTDLTEAQARAYIDALVAAGLFEWMAVYRPSQGTFVLDSANWRLKVEFEGEKRAFVCEGENFYPDNFEQVVNLLLGKEIS